MDPEFLSVNEFAKKLSKHQNSIRRAIKSNVIIAIRIGKGSRASFRIHISEINRVGMVNLENIVNKLVEEKLKEREDL